MAAAVCLSRSSAAIRLSPSSFGIRLCNPNSSSVIFSRILHCYTIHSEKVKNEGSPIKKVEIRGEIEEKKIGGKIEEKKIGGKIEEKKEETREIKNFEKEVGGEIEDKKEEPGEYNWMESVSSGSWRKVGRYAARFKRYAARFARFGNHYVIGYGKRNSCRSCRDDEGTRKPTDRNESQLIEMMKEHESQLIEMMKKHESLEYGKRNSKLKVYRCIDDKGTRKPIKIRKRQLTKIVEIEKQEYECGREEAA